MNLIVFLSAILMSSPLSAKAYENPAEVIKNCEIMVYGVSVNDCTARAGSNNQFSGNKKTMVVTIGVDERKLGHKVRSVGFEGVVVPNTGVARAFRLNKAASEQYNNNLWDFEFPVSSKIAWDLRDNTFSGVFFVETDAATYLMKLNNRSDFIFDRHSIPELSFYHGGCN